MSTEGICIRFIFVIFGFMSGLSAMYGLLLRLETCHYA